MSEPLVSIIIPTYNRAKLLYETIGSILAQSYIYWECIVVDDGSDDGTAQVVQSFMESDPRIKFFNRPVDMVKGANSCRNYGFLKSSGSFVNWFDSDDLMLPDFLSLKLKAFQSHIDLVLCEALEFHDNKDESSILKIDCKINLFKDYVFWKSHIITDSVMFRRSFLEHKILFDPYMARGQEAEFFSRIFFNLTNDQWAVVKKPLFKYRIHNRSKSSLDKTYLKLFKESQSKVAYENLKRGVVIEDHQIIQYCYRLLVNFYFRALEHNHRQLSHKILSQLLPILKKLNFSLWVQWLVLGHVFLNFNRGFYKIEMYFKTYKIHTA